LLPALVTMVWPPGFLTMTGTGTPSWVWPPRIASMPVTREAILRSTSMPLWLSSTTACAPLARASFTVSCISLSRMPKVQLGVSQAGLAIGV
jgi:hypothetical protein